MTEQTPEEQGGDDIEYVQPAVTVRTFYEAGEISTMTVEFVDQPDMEILARTIAQFLTRPPAKLTGGVSATWGNPTVNRVRPQRPVRPVGVDSTCGAVANVIYSPMPQRGVTLPRTPDCDNHECLLPAGHPPVSDLAEHTCHFCAQNFGGIPGVKS